MAGQSDGSIIIDTELNSDGFKAGSDELLAAIKNLTDAIKNLGTTLQILFDKSLTPDIDTSIAEDKVSALESQARETEAALEDLQSTGPTGKSTGPQVNMGGTTQKASELQREIDAVNTSVERLEPTFQKAMSGSESAMTTFEGKASTLEDKIDELQKNLDAFGATEFPTEDYTWLQTELERADKVLGNFKDKQEKMQALGVKESSKQWQSLQYDIDLTKKEIAEYQDRIAELENSGKAFQMGIDTAQYAQLSGELEKAKENLAEMQSEADSVNNSLQKQVTLSNTIKNTFTSVKTSISGVAGSFLSLFKNTNKASGGFSGGLKALLKYGIGVRSLFALVNKLRSALVEGYQNLAQYDSKVNRSISSVMSALTQLKNSFATAFAPILNTVAPILTQLITLLSTATSYLGQFFAALTGSSTYTKATAVQEDYADSLSDTASAAEDAQRQLMGFDEMNVLNSSSSGSSGTSASSMFETVDIPLETINWAEQIKQAIEDGDWRGTGTVLAEKLNDVISSFNLEEWGKNLGGKINNGLNFAYGFVTNFDWTTLGNKIASGLNGVLEAVDWNLLGQTFALKWNSLMDLLYEAITTFNGEEFGAVISETILGWFNEINWERIPEIISSALETAGEIVSGFFSSFGIDGTALEESFERLSEAISPLADVISTTLYWGYENVLLPLSSWAIEEAVPTVIEALSSAIEFLTSALEAVQPFAQWMWESFLQPLGEWTGDLFISAMELINSLLEDLTSLLSGDTSIGEFLDNLSLGETLLLSVATAFGVVTAAVTIWNTVATIATAVTTALGAVIAVLTSPITLIIAAIAALVAGFVLLYQKCEPFQEFIDNIVAEAKELIPGIKQGIEEGWAAFTEWLDGLWSSIVEGFKSFFGIHSPSTVMAEMGSYLIDGLLNGITDVWESITGFFDGALDGLSSLISGAWENIKSTASTVWEGIKSTVTGAWDSIESGVSSAYETVKSGVSSAWENIKSTTSSTWAKTKNTVSTVWDEIKTTTSSVSSAVEEKASEAWSSVKSYITDNLDAAKTKASTVWDSIKSTSSSVSSSIKSTLSNTWNNIKTTMTSTLSSMESSVSLTFNNLKSSALTWGKDICSNLASGIKNGISTVTSAVSSVASSIKDFLGFSEPDKGPLSNFHTYMPDMLDLMASGIKKNQDTAIDAVSDVADAISSEIQNGEYAFGSMDTGIDYVLTSFADRVSDSFTALLDKLQAIAENVRFTAPNITNGIIPYSVTYSGSGANNNAAFPTGWIDELAEKIADKINSTGINGKTTVNLQVDLDGKTIAKSTWNETDAYVQRTGTLPFTF